MTGEAWQRIARVGHLIGWHGPRAGLVSVEEDANPLATAMPVADVAAFSLGAVGAVAGEIAMLRGAPRPKITVSRRAAALAMCANDYLGLDGAPVRSWPELTRYYRARDGWVYLHAGFPPHTRRLLAALGAPEDREGLEARVAGMDATEIEARCVAANTCGRRVRTVEEWGAEPACLAIAGRPVIGFEPLGEGAVRPWTPAVMPLAGIRVLDLSRVLAGPTIGRTLAEHGADVLRIAGPGLPYSEALVMDTGYGKRSAFVDLETAEGRTALAELIRGADVVIDGYRPGALARHGLSPAGIAALRPGIVHLTLSAWGEHGPWAGQRGYDSLVQATIGFAVGDPPKRLPCQPLDYLTGYLGAFAIMRALMIRAETGRGTAIELTLAGIGHWLRRMAAEFPDDPAPPDRNPTAAEIAGERCTVPSAFGEITALRPALDVPWRPREWQPPVSLGSSPAIWA